MILIINLRCAWWRMKKTRYFKLSLILFTFSILLELLLTAKSPGDYYTPHHIANLYLPYFGYGSEYSSLSDSGYTMFTFYILRYEILQFIPNHNPLYLYQVIYLFKIHNTFFAFIILFGISSITKKYRFLLSIIFSLAISFPGIPILLIAIILSSLYKLINNNKDVRTILIFIITFSCLSLYWHTMSIVIFIIVIIYILFSILINTNKFEMAKQSSSLLLIGIVITFGSWIFLRSSGALDIALNSLFNTSELLNPGMLYKGIFSSGSFVDPQFQYNFDFYIDKFYIDTLRYISYIISYLILIIIFICIVNKKYNKNNKIFYSLLIVLLISDIITKILHYVSTNTIGADVWIILLYPLVLGYIVWNINYNKNKLLKITAISISVIMLLSIIFTTAFLFYSQYNAYPSMQTEYSSYESSFFWASDHTSNPELISDANTIGYFQIMFTKNNIYDKNDINNTYMQDQEYYQINDGNYSISNNTYVIINTELAEKHLIFSSLTYWNTFIPLNTTTVDKNELNRIYNDNFNIIYK